jgi:RNA polymerase sigma-70 factor (ECF subfamily)
LGHAERDAGDIALLRRIAGGDMEAFQLFYERYAGRVLAYARQLSRFSSPTDLTEDVVQEVFVAVWRKAASFQADRGDPCGWLYTITRNKMVDLWRRRGEASGLDEDSLQQIAEPAAPGSELLLTMRQALTQVPAEQRAAIELAYFGGLTYEETAERLHLPLGTLKSRIRSGLRTLRTLLEGH